MQMAGMIFHGLMPVTGSQRRTVATIKPITAVVTHIHWDHIGGHMSFYNVPIKADKENGKMAVCSYMRIAIFLWKNGRLRGNKDILTEDDASYYDWDEYGSLEKQREYFSEIIKQEISQ